MGEEYSIPRYGLTGVGGLAGILFLMPSDPDPTPAPQLAQIDTDHGSWIGRFQRRLVSAGAVGKASMLKLKSILAQEPAETKAMLEVYARAARGEATKAELRAANTQARDILKMAGLGVLVVLPGTVLILPTVIYAGKKIGIDILPRETQGLKVLEAGESPLPDPSSHLPPPPGARI